MSPLPCPGNLNNDEQVEIEDLQAVAGILLQAGPGAPGFIVSVEAGHCGNMNDDLQIDLENMQAVAVFCLTPAAHLLYYVNSVEPGKPEVSYQI